jgi:hypothetical protein
LKHLIFHLQKKDFNQLRSCINKREITNSVLKMGHLKHRNKNIKYFKLRIYCFMVVSNNKGTPQYKRCFYAFLRFFNALFPFLNYICGLKIRLT